MEEIEIRLLREEDIPGIGNLYKKAYKITRSNDKFRWEFQSGPAGPAIYVVAVDPKVNRVVGTQCAIPLYVIDASGNRILTAKSEDTLVDSDYRGKSIFEKMYALLFDECRMAGIVAIWGFTYALKPFTKLGFEIPFHCNFGLIAFKTGGAYKYLNSLKEKRTVGEKMKIFALATASRTKYRFKSRYPHVTGYSISKHETISLENLPPTQPGVFFLQLDSNFLDWRLRSNPYPNSHLYYSLIDETNKQVASVICSFTPQVSYIMHLAFDRSLVEETRLKFLKAVNADLSTKTDVVRFWGFSHNEAGSYEIQLLKRSGFMFTKQGISMVWKKLDEKSSLNVSDFALSRMASQGT
jgi:hypothetical protein